MHFSAAGGGRCWQGGEEDTEQTRRALLSLFAVVVYRREKVARTEALPQNIGLCLGCDPEP